MPVPTDVPVTGQSPELQAARGLLALIQPITGHRASGQVHLVAPTGLTVEIPRNRHLVPVLDGELRHDLLFKTAKGNAEDGSWIVTDTGLNVDVISNVGGARHNLPAGTAMQFDPPCTVLNLTTPPALLADATGGTTPTAYASVQDAVVYDSTDGPVVSLDLRRSLLKSYPGVVVAWHQTLPQDGPSSQHAAGRTRAGTLKYIYSQRFSLTLITSRADSEAARRGEGLAAMNGCRQLIAGREGIDGYPISSPSGIRILAATREFGPQPEYQKFAVFTLLLSVEGSLQTIDDRSYADWLKTKISVDKP